ncbi:hypothetical protein NJG17_10750 [Stenotrophomonas maltophilia]|jgi:hypothetical protein|uniref:hypothetical protein n=1 Tax=Stenotrophomonas maltophilia TaxID=40324 RepID=UPI000F77F104|nr:hypothetical protein [Stenotrophomonas maltophilia]MBN4996691.1 hypothetical protein [Stenotrophomonas maltophilia]MCO7500376.1 hypothetical protein [Stenotrophomonas maltophilia]RRU79307.1 hypothetical protein EGJ24_14290 [Stenotrophomonas maltophilia]HEL5028300.1 hypothetical protein [Stenotrophomonas maltophilia]
MKLQLAAMAALVMATATLAPVADANAVGPKENVSCVPVKVDHNRVHQHCTETYTDEFGNVYEAEYWIDEYGNPYLRD